MNKNVLQSRAFLFQTGSATTSFCPVYYIDSFSTPYYLTSTFVHTLLVTGMIYGFL